MRNTATLDDITWDMLARAGINARNAHYFPEQHFVVYSEDGMFKATFGPAIDMVDGDDGTEGDLGWVVRVDERFNDAWDFFDQVTFSTAQETLTYVAAVLDYAEDEA